MVRATNAGGEAKSIADCAILEPSPERLQEVVKTIVYETGPVAPASEFKTEVSVHYYVNRVEDRDRLFTRAVCRFVAAACNVCLRLFLLPVGCLNELFIMADYWTAVRVNYSATNLLQ